MMIIISPHSSQTGWITAIIENHWLQAKVYDEPSEYGIYNGRVSKIAISKTASRDPKKNFFDQMCYNYDRGLDFSNISEEVLKKIILQLEKLPKLYS